MIKIIHSSILCKWANLQNLIIIAPTANTIYVGSLVSAYIGQDNGHGACVNLLSFSAFANHYDIISHFKHSVWVAFPDLFVPEGNLIRSINHWLH